MRKSKFTPEQIPQALRGLARLRTLKTTWMSARPAYAGMVRRPTLEDVQAVSPLLWDDGPGDCSGGSFARVCGRGLKRSLRERLRGAGFP